MLYIRLHLAVFPDFVNLSPKEWFRYHHFGVLRYNLELFFTIWWPRVKKTPGNADVFFWGCWRANSKKKVVVHMLFLFEIARLYIDERHINKQEVKWVKSTTTIFTIFIFIIESICGTKQEKEQTCFAYAWYCVHFCEDILCVKSKL